MMSLRASAGGLIKKGFHTRSIKRELYIFKNICVNTKIIVFLIGTVNTIFTVIILGGVKLVALAVNYS